MAQVGFDGGCPAADPRNCVPIVDSLVERALLSREVDSTDRRRRVLCLTPKGQRLAEDLETGNAEVESKLLSPFGAKEQVALRRMLAAIVESSANET